MYHPTQIVSPAQPKEPSSCQKPFNTCPPCLHCHISSPDQEGKGNLERKFDHFTCMNPDHDRGHSANQNTLGIITYSTLVCLCCPPFLCLLILLLLLLNSRLLPRSSFYSAFSSKLPSGFSSYSEQATHASGTKWESLQTQHQRVSFPGKPHTPHCLLERLKR